ATVFITDMSRKPEMNRAWDEWVDKANPPQRACIGVALEDKDLVEIRAIAAEALQSTQEAKASGSRDQAALPQPACGLSTRSVEAGYFASIAAGRTGRRNNSPPQLGQRPPGSRLATQSVQKVHSKVQIMASAASGGRSLSQHSQLGLSMSIVVCPCCGHTEPSVGAPDKANGNGHRQAPPSMAP